jgi:hypothetical protein
MPSYKAIIKGQEYFSTAPGSDNKTNLAKAKLVICAKAMKHQQLTLEDTKDLIVESFNGKIPDNAVRVDFNSSTLCEEVSWHIRSSYLSPVERYAEHKYRVNTGTELDKLLANHLLLGEKESELQKEATKSKETVEQYRALIHGLLEATDELLEDFNLKDKFKASKEEIKSLSLRIAELENQLQLTKGNGIQVS